MYFLNEDYIYLLTIQYTPMKNKSQNAKAESLY